MNATAPMRGRCFIGTYVREMTASAAIGCHGPANTMANKDHATLVRSMHRRGDRHEGMMDVLRQGREQADDLERTIPRIQRVDPERGGLWGQVDDNVLGGRSALVPRDVGVFADVEVPLPRGANDRRAGGVVGHVERHRPRHDLNEHGTRVAVPTALTARLEDDALHGDVEVGRGLHLRVLVAGDPLHLERLVRRITERRSTEERQRGGQAFAPYERDIRRPHGIGVRGPCEARLSGEDLAGANDETWGRSPQMAGVVLRCSY